jgi:hypothetical protein
MGRRSADQYFRKWTQTFFFAGAYFSSFWLLADGQLVFDPSTMSIQPRVGIHTTSNLVADNGPNRQSDRHSSSVLSSPPQMPKAGSTTEERKQRHDARVDGALAT